MILDDAALKKLVKKGVKLVGANGEPIRLKEDDEIVLELAPKGKSELHYLRSITDLLVRFVHRPPPESPKIEQPNITVMPPEVTVNQPPIVFPKPISKWKFVLTKNKMGQTTEIVATGIE